MKTKINGCNFLSKKRINFFVNFFFDHLIQNFNQGLRKCPIKKGSYVVVEARERVKDTQMAIPPFIKTNQQIFISVNLKAVVNGKMRDMLTVNTFFKVIE